MTTTVEDEITIQTIHDNVVDIKERLTTIRQGEDSINQQAWIIFGVSVVLVILSTVIPIIVVEVKAKQEKKKRCG